MKLIKNKEFLQNAANFIDVMNTIGGGIVQTTAVLEKRKKGSIIRVSAPSVNPEAFQVRLNDNVLSIFATLPKNEETTWTAPLFHQDFILTPNVALDAIRAVYKQNELQVRLPFRKNNNRPIEIELEEED